MEGGGSQDAVDLLFDSFHSNDSDFLVKELVLGLLGLLVFFSEYFKRFTEHYSPGLIYDIV